MPQLPAEEGIEALVARVEAGDAPAREQLFAALYDELHRMAERELRRSGPALALSATGAWAGMEEAKAFLDAEIGELSTLDRAGQEAEMQWFIDAAQPFAGMEIKVVSENITTHVYESQTLAPAFTAITGITVTHDLIGELPYGPRIGVKVGEPVEPPDLATLGRPLVVTAPADGWVQQLSRRAIVAATPPGTTVSAALALAM